MSGARATDPWTSHAAFGSLNVPKLEMEVFEKIVEFGEEGCITDDIVKELPQMRNWTVSPRQAPLLEKGLIEDTGRVRKSDVNKNQRVVRAVPPERMVFAALNHLLNLYTAGKIQLTIIVRETLPDWVAELVRRGMNREQSNNSSSC